MRWLVLIAVGGVLAFAQLGCVSGNMTETPAEIAHRQRRVMEVDARSIQEDIELFLMTDRPLRLTKWQVE